MIVIFLVNNILPTITGMKETKRKTLVFIFLNIVELMFFAII